MRALRLADGLDPSMSMAVQSMFSVPPPVAGVDVLHQEPSCQVLAHSNLLIVNWTGQQSPATCARAYELSVSLAERCGVGKISVVSLANKEMRLPTQATRDALSRLHSDPFRVLHRTAVVLESDGFVASIIHSVILSVRQNARRRQGHDQFQSLEKALNWVTEGLPIAGDRPISLPQVMHALGRLEFGRTSRVA